MLHKLPDDIQELGRTPLFRDLSKRELAAVQSVGTVVDRAAGTVICQTCQSVRQVAVILSGVIATTPDGGRRYQLGAGDFFGVLSDSRHPAPPQHVEAVTDVSLFVIGERDYTALRMACPRLAERLATLAEPRPTKTWAQVGNWHQEAVAANT